jgi:hypothetical protein
VVPSADLHAAELTVEDWRRLIAVADLTASEQDRRILDELRRAAVNGDHHGKC